VHCPKDRIVELVDSQLEGQLPTKRCPSCDGNWIPPEEYAAWKANFPEVGRISTLIDRILDAECAVAPLDAKAALCPDCSCFLARSKVSTRNPFYLERCPNCKGIWCDRGEWEVLTQLGLTTAIDHCFSPEWQTCTREREQLSQERRATVEKLGPELAAQIFQLAEVLEKHPNGDFGVAYLMRRFDK